MKKLVSTQLIATSATVLLFIFLSYLWSRHFFSFQDLSSHAITDGDPGLNAWALSWVTRALTSDISNLFNGNTFYPHAGAITLSEHMASLAIFTIPTRWFTTDPWIAYNAIIFYSYFFSALGGYIFVRYLTNNNFAGVWGGIFWGFCFFRIHHIGHIQIISYQWFPFIALFLMRTLREPTLKNAGLLTLLFVLQALTSWYLAVISAFLVIILFTFDLSSTRWTGRHFISFGISATLVSLVMFPFASPYIDAIQETTLGDRLNSALSIVDQVKPLDYFIPPSSTYIGSLIKENKYWIWGENTLYIGYSACLLSLLGLVYCWHVNRRMAYTSLALITPVGRSNSPISGQVKLPHLSGL